MIVTTEKHHADQRYITGIAAGDAQILDEIYVNYSKAIFKLVQKNNGTLEDAKDVIQESLIVIYKKAKQSELVLTSSFLSFFYGVCRRVWWRILRNRKGKMTPISEELDLVDELDIEQAILRRERHEFYLEKLKELSAGCRQILQLYIEGKTAREIIKVMGFTSENYVRKRKYKCKEQLLNRVKRDAKYKELML